MLKRQIHTAQVTGVLQQFPVVAIVGARQVGKTTLAMDVRRRWKGTSHSFDLESPVDLGRLADPMLVLSPLPVW